jgi:hypothetical protein
VWSHRPPGVHIGRMVVRRRLRARPALAPPLVSGGRAHPDACRHWGAVRVSTPMPESFKLVRKFSLVSTCVS